MQRTSLTLLFALAACGGKAAPAPPPLRPQAPEQPVKRVVAKTDCDPVSPDDEEPAKPFARRSITEAENLANEGIGFLQSAEGRDIAPESREEYITEAVNRFINALRADPYNVNATYNLAAAYARIGRVECSINLLKRVLQMRDHHSRKDQVEQKLDRLLGRRGARQLDPDFADLRGDVRFRTLIERMCERDNDPSCVYGAGQ